MVGSAIIRKLLSLGYTNIIASYHKRQPITIHDTRITFVKIDLTRQSDVEAFFKRERPDYVFLAAAKVGGILANYNYPADFIYSNLIVQTNIVNSAYLYGVKKLLFLGSSCIYPKFAPQPMKEEYLLTGELEPTNEPYAVAKIAGIRMCQSYNRQYGTNFISVMPTNLYGPNDTFDIEISHVLPAMIKKFHDAKLLMATLSSSSNLRPPTSNQHPQPVVELWGSGSPRREFLHVDDLADACLFVMQNVDAVSSSPHASRFTSYNLLNIGTGEDITIKELAEIIKETVGYSGEIIWDSTKPDGTPRKLLDVSRLKSLGWEPKIELRDGIRMTYDWYLSQLTSKPRP